MKQKNISNPKSGKSIIYGKFQIDPNMDEVSFQLYDRNHDTVISFDLKN